MKNRFDMEFIGISENEAFARTVVAAFTAMLDPTVEELAELKTAVSEAVTNAIVHAYPEESGFVVLSGRIDGNTVYITISDNGIGIADVDKAREPLFTGKPEEERSGLGFSIMESFCDSITVTSGLGEGTVITLEKRFGGSKGEI
ncbi:MAG: anti-sigma F factor [Clostridia bacterium]|nr:anti-sigma F factor [Clostridia bacterium]